MSAGTRLVAQSRELSPGLVAKTPAVEQGKTLVASDPSLNEGYPQPASHYLARSANGERGTQTSQSSRKNTEQNKYDGELPQFPDETDVPPGQDREEITGPAGGVDGKPADPNAQLPRPNSGAVPVDVNVLSKFPGGTKILSVETLNSPAWTNTERLVLELVDGTEQEYFLKSASKDHGRVMMEGEFNSMTHLYKWAPDFVPKPHSWGKYQKEDPDTYFFLSEFLHMSEEMPNSEHLCSNMARLHKESRSPTGNFGVSCHYLPRSHCPMCWLGGELDGVLY